jgi:hypothetical protein
MAKGHVCGQSNCPVRVGIAPLSVIDELLQEAPADYAGQCFYVRTSG